MVSGPRGDGNQCHRVGILDPLLYLLLFPNGHAGAGGHHELEHCHVWRHIFVRYCLLLGQGEEGVHSSGENCEAGRLVKVEEALHIDERQCKGER